MKRTRITKAMVLINVQRAVTPKVDRPELRCLSSAYLLFMLYICVKFHENMSIGFRVMKRKRMLKALTDSDGRTLKISEPRHFLVAGHKNLFVIN